MERTKDRILFIRCGSVFSKGRVASSTTTPPLGIAYLAACLRKENFKVSAIDAVGEAPTRITQYPEFDLCGLTNEEVMNRLPSSNNVRIFAFSSMFSNEWVYLRELIAMIKLTYPESITLLGGEHASALPVYSLESCVSLDYVISGEGEGSIVEFVKSVFNAKNNILAIGGLTYRTTEGIKTNPKAARIKNIDDIPPPAWDLLPVENYLKEGIATITKKGQRVMPMLASRGCPYECKFCTNPNIYGTRYYVRDGEDFIRELKFLKSEYAISGFELHDLTFITKKTWVKSLCRRLLEEDLKLTWNVPTTRSEAIDEEVVSLLKEAGCKNLCLTPDSGSPRMLKEMLKKVNLEKITKTARTILKSGIILKVNIVIGFPGERHYDVWLSILYGMKLAFYGVDSIYFYRFVPYPGSEYFELLRSQGKLPPFGAEFDKFLVKNVYNELSLMKSWSENISDRWIQVYMFLGYALSQMTYFLCRPLEIYRTAKRIILDQPAAHSDLLIKAFLKKKFSIFSKQCQVIRSL